MIHFIGVKRAKKIKKLFTFSPNCVIIFIENEVRKNDNFYIQRKDISMFGAH